MRCIEAAAFFTWMKENVIERIKSLLLHKIAFEVFDFKAQTACRYANYYAILGVKDVTECSF